MVGLKDLHKLTSEGNYGLQVDLKDFSNNCFVAVYEQFKVREGLTKKVAPQFGHRLQLFLNAKNVDLSDIQNDSLSKILLK